MTIFARKGAPLSTTLGVPGAIVGTSSAAGSASVVGLTTSAIPYCAALGTATVGVLGETYAAGAVALQGIAATSASQALNTNGGVQMIGLGEATGAVLTSDAAGNATWQTAPGIVLSAFPASITVPNNTFVPITQWGFINSETGGANYNSTTANIPLQKPGAYQILATVVWQPFVCPDVRIQLFTDGAFDYETTANFNSGYGSTNMVYTRRFNAGQKIKLGLYQNSGSTQHTTGLTPANMASVQLLHTKSLYHENYFSNGYSFIVMLCRNRATT